MANRKYQSVSGIFRHSVRCVNHGLAILALMLLCATTGVSAAQSLASTPPMGWNSWNHFRKKVTEADIRAAADALVSSGMRDAGYTYVNIDAGWQGERDAQGVLHVDAKKFGDMKALADYLHSRGLKLGIYSSPGPETCAAVGPGYPGSLGHEAQDAQMYAAWGVDFLKYDLCSFSPIMSEEAQGNKDKELAVMKAAYQKMHQALVATGRPIVYSLCQYGDDQVWRWGASVGGQMWRTTHDIQDNYISMSEIGFSQAGLSQFAGPGHWNDPDMLEIGNGGMKPDGERTQMSLWSLLAAPLLAGNDLTKMDATTKDILLNKEIIAIDQDPLGKAGDRVWAEGPLELWARPLANGDYAVGLFNRNGMSANMQFSLKDIHWQGPANLRDLWAHKDLPVVEKSQTFLVPAHGVVMLRISHRRT